MFEVTPLKIGNRLYLSTPYNRVVALDAGTGKVHRGVAAWKGGRSGKMRIFLNTRYRLIALDAETGKPAQEFGDNGIVNLLTHMRLGRGQREGDRSHECLGSDDAGRC